MDYTDEIISQVNNFLRPSNLQKARGLEKGEQLVYYNYFIDGNSSYIKITVCTYDSSGNKIRQKTSGQYDLVYTFELGNLKIVDGDDDYVDAEGYLSTSYPSQMIEEIEHFISDLDLQKRIRP